MGKAIILMISLGILTGLLAIWQIQIPEKSFIATEDAQNWTLPTLPQVDNAQTVLNQLRKLNPWGITEEATSNRSTARKTTTDWKLVGIVQQGRQRYILLADKNDKISQYHFESQLPDGTRLLTIHDDFIEILRAGQTEVIHLYR
jgi:hypothetical protein